MKIMLFVHNYVVMHFGELKWSNKILKEWYVGLVMIWEWIVISMHWQYKANAFIFGHAW